MPMKLKVLSVHNQGDESKEHVLMKVLEDCDIGRYLLADSTYTDTDRVSNKLRHIFWFPGKQVKAGELASVWTGKGKDTEATSKDGTKIHRFFWGLGSAVWNDDKDCAILIEANNWKFKRVNG